MFSKTLFRWISKWSLSRFSFTEDVLDLVVGVLLLPVVLNELADHFVLVSQGVLHVFDFLELGLFGEAAVQVQHEGLELSGVISASRLLERDRPVFVRKVLFQFLIFVVASVDVESLQIFKRGLKQGRPHEQTREENSAESYFGAKHFIVWAHQI